MKVEELTSQGRFPPTRNDMLELPDDYQPDLFLRYWFALQFEGDGWLTAEQKWTLVNHARLTDKAIREYRAASECLTAFVEAERAPASPTRAPNSVSVAALQKYMMAGDHLENCVNAVKRAGRFWYHAIEYAGHDPQPFEPVFGPLKDMREKIEHADRDLKKGIGDGEPLFITVLAESVYLNDTEIEYADLVIAITLLHFSASFLIDSADGAPPVPAALTP